MHGTLADPFRLSHISKPRGMYAQNAQEGQALSGPKALRTKSCKAAIGRLAARNDASQLLPQTGDAMSQQCQPVPAGSCHSLRWPVGAWTAM